jgi:hypothetical protein
LTVAVFDDTPGADPRERTRQFLSELARRTGARILYAGLEEKRRFASALASEDAAPPDVIEDALFGWAGLGPGVGANRNAVLLHTQGEKVVSVDDDTTCHVVGTPGPASSSGWSWREEVQMEYRWFPDRMHALAWAPRLDMDFLGAHEAALGQEIDRGASSSGPARRQVRVTQNGLIGDSAFNYAAYLYSYVRGESLERLLRSEAEYRCATTSRELLRGVDRPVVSGHTFCQSVLLGLDNREPMPPFMPSGRTEDGLFGETIARTLPEVCFGHLPFAVLHAPLEARRLSSLAELKARPAPQIEGLATHEILRACMEGFTPGSAAGSRSALVRLGEHLLAMGQLPLEDFQRQVLQTHRELQQRFFAEQRELLRSAGPAAVTAWASDLAQWLSFEEERLPAKQVILREALQRGERLEEARVKAREVATRFGRLLVHWSGLTASARALRLRDRPLAVPPSDLQPL